MGRIAKKRKELDDCNAFDYVLGLTGWEEKQTLLSERKNNIGSWPTNTQSSANLDVVKVCQTLDQELKRKLDHTSERKPELSSQLGSIMNYTVDQMEQTITQCLKLADYVYRSDPSIQKSKLTHNDVESMCFKTGNIPLW